MNLKKQIGLTLLFTAVFSFASEIKQEVTEYENRTKGFEASVAQESHVVFGGETHLFDKGVGEYKTIDGEQYFFPNGYTEPTIEAGRSCYDGFNVIYHLNCWGTYVINLNKGWLNLTKTQNDGHLYMHNNYYANIDNLANLVHAGGQLNFQDSKLENTDGLSNLITIKGYLSLKNTKLTNITGLRNLRYTSGRIYLGNNELLADISGLNGLAYLGDKLEVDNKEYKVKLAADSYLCQNPTKIVYHGTETIADKSKVCSQN